MNAHLFVGSLLIAGLMACQGGSEQHPVSDASNTPDPIKSTNTGHAPQPSVEHNTPALGIDVSHFQGNVDWEEIKAAGIKFAYAKASQGSGYEDPKYPENRMNMQKAKMPCGSYHFYMAGEDPLHQAKLFIRQVQTLQKGDMPPMLDLEQGGMKEGVDKAQFQANVLIWLKKIEEELGVRPIIYTDHPFGQSYLTNPEFANYHLWIAAYDVPKPMLPEVWQEKGWLIWQRTERGNVEGAIGNVDHDLMKGGMQQLQTLLK